MITGMVVSLALGVVSMHPDLAALDQEIASLRRERATLNTFSDNDRRDQVDKQIRMLQTVASRSESIMEQRMSACYRRTPNGAPSATLPPPGSPAATALAVSCANTAGGVVGTVRRIEEIRLLLASKRDWGDREAASGLQAEMASLEASLRTYY